LYAVGVLNLLMDVVGRNSLVGKLLQQTQNEIVSLLAEGDERASAA
jgi:hypothetical protein